MIFFFRKNICWKHNIMSVCQILRQASIKYLYILIERIQMVQQFFSQQVKKKFFFLARKFTISWVLLFIRQYSCSIKYCRSLKTTLCSHLFFMSRTFVEVFLISQYFIQFILNLQHHLLSFLIFFIHVFFYVRNTTHNISHNAYRKQLPETSECVICLFIDLFKMLTSLRHVL